MRRFFALLCPSPGRQSESVLHCFWEAQSGSWFSAQLRQTKFFRRKIPNGYVFTLSDSTGTLLWPWHWGLDTSPPPCDTIDLTVFPALPCSPYCSGPP